MKSFSHSTQTNPLKKYQKKSQRYQWVVTGTRAVQIPLLKADSTEVCAENIDVTWSERNLDEIDPDLAWSDNDQLKVSCASADKCCEALEFNGMVFERVDYDSHRKKSEDSSH